jgi:hypothetical protein
MNFTGGNMTRLTLVSGKNKYMVQEESNEMSLNELLPMIEQLIKAAGYNPSGQLDFVEE